MKKIILPILILTFLLSSCQKENVEYNMLIDEIIACESNLADFSVETNSSIIAEENAYGLLVSSYEKQSELYDEADVLNAKLIALQGIIKDDIYALTQEDISALETQIAQCTSEADTYYAENVCSRIETMLDDYAAAPGPASDIESYNALINEIAFLEGTTAEQNAILQGQMQILSAFEACSNSYTQWIAASETFAANSLLSESKETSRALVHTYLDETNVFYETHLTGLNSVSSLDTSFHKNAEKFTQLFSGYSAIYEKAIENLEEALTH